MAEAKPFSTDNLNSYFWMANSAQDKEVSGGFSVYNGRSNFAVRRKGQAGRPMASVNIAPEQLWTFVYAADLLVKQGPKGKIKLTIQQWNNEDRKFKDVGVFILGLDERMVPYFGLSTPEIGAHAFPIRLKRPNILGDESISKEDGAVITIKAVCRDIAEHLTQLEVLLNQKRDFNNNNRGGGNSGGGGRPANTQKPASTSESLDDELPF